MSLVQRALYTVAGLIAAVLQLLIKAAFGPGEASKTSQRGRSKGNDARGPSQPREKEKQTSLSGDALVRLCRGLQEEVRRKEKDLTGCKADVRALRLERRRAAQERKQEAEQKEFLWQQLKFEADERSEIESEHRKMMAAMQKDLTYAQHARGAFQAQVCQLEREVSNLRGELAAKGHEESDMWQERSKLIDDKARLGRQIIELSKRAQQAEADLAASRATATALASNNAELQDQFAKQSSAHARLEQRADELAGELAATKAELNQEVEDLRDVLTATLEDKAALASQYSALEAQADYMEADSMQLRAWLEEVIQANDALEGRVEVLEASAAMADHERSALEGWVRGSVEEQAAAATRLASFQALSKGLEKDGVCKSAVIGVLAIHLVQRERQLYQILRGPVASRMHALQGSSAGETIKDGDVEVSLTTSAPAKQLAQELSSELAAGHEPRTPSRFALPAPSMASTSSSGQSSPCNGSAEEATESSQPPSAMAPAQAALSGPSAECARPSTALSRSSSGMRVPARAATAGAANISSIRRTASSAAAMQIPLPRELVLLSRARSTLPPQADGSAHALWQDRLEHHLRSRGTPACRERPASAQADGSAHALWQERLEHHLRSRGAPACPKRPASARAHTGPQPSAPQMFVDLGAPMLPDPTHSSQKALAKGPQVLTTA